MYKIRHVQANWKQFRRYPHYLKCLKCLMLVFTVQNKPVININFTYLCSLGNQQLSGHKIKMVRTMSDQKQMIISCLGCLLIFESASRGFAHFRLLPQQAVVRMIPDHRMILFFFLKTICQPLVRIVKVIKFSIRLPIIFFYFETQN